MTRPVAIWTPTRTVLFALALSAATRANASTGNVDCNTGGAIGPALAKLKPGDVLLVQGSCRENVLIHSEVNGITLDGQGKATISAIDARQPAVQVLGREVTIKGFTVTGGFFGVAVNRGATATIDNNTIEGATHSGVEISQNSFGRVINSTIRHNRQNGILVLGSASAHIGVLRSDDEPAPNVILDNESDGIHVIRASDWPCNRPPMPTSPATSRAHRPWSAPAALVQSEQSADALSEGDPAQEGAKSLTAMTRGVKLRPRAA